MPSHYGIIGVFELTPRRPRRGLIEMYLPIIVHHPPIRLAMHIVFVMLIRLLLDARAERRLALLHRTTSLPYFGGTFPEAPTDQIGSLCLVVG